MHTSQKLSMKSKRVTSLELTCYNIEYATCEVARIEHGKCVRCWAVMDEVQ